MWLSDKSPSPDGENGVKIILFSAFLSAMTCFRRIFVILYKGIKNPGKGA